MVASAGLEFISLAAGSSVCCLLVVAHWCLGSRVHLEDALYSAVFELGEQGDDPFHEMSIGMH